MVEAALHAAEIQFDVIETQRPFHALEIAEEAAHRYSSVIAVGGDGTVHEVANGLLRASSERTTTPLGVIPLGNGDDFAKMIPPRTPIGGRPFDWQAAVKKIARGDTGLFDVGRILTDSPRPELGAGAHYFVNSMDVGFGAQGALNFYTIPKILKGLSAYIATALKTLVNYPTLQLRIQLDDKPPIEQASTMTAVMNGRCFGNGFWVCPEASADDGIFDLMVSESVGRLTILRLLMKLMRGTHVGEPVLKMLRARQVRIESSAPIAVEADGEIPYLNAQRVEVELLPQRLQVIL
jgi:YegS/Rv2252/BmrU family lipid kinase